MFHDSRTMKFGCACSNTRHAQRSPSSAVPFSARSGPSAGALSDIGTAVRGLLSRLFGLQRLPDEDRPRMGRTRSARLGVPRLPDRRRSRGALGRPRRTPKPARLERCHRTYRRTHQPNSHLSGASPWRTADASLRAPSRCWTSRKQRRSSAPATDGGGPPPRPRREPPRPTARAGRLQDRTAVDT